MRKPGRVRPYLESLVLCDEIRFSGNTDGMPDGIHDLIRVRATLQTPPDASFPYCHPVLYLFLRVSGPASMVHGTIAMQREGDPSWAWELQFAEPIELWGFDKSAHHVVQLVDVEFPCAGVYWFRVRIDRNPVDEVRLLVE